MATWEILLCKVSGRYAVEVEEVMTYLQLIQGLGLHLEEIQSFAYVFTHTQ